MEEYDCSYFIVLIIVSVVELILIFCILLLSCIYVTFDKPKSPIFRSVYLIASSKSLFSKLLDLEKTLSERALLSIQFPGLRSLWIHPFVCICLIPDRRFLANFATNFYGSPLLMLLSLGKFFEKYFFCLCNKELRSPPFSNLKLRTIFLLPLISKISTSSIIF